MTTNDMATRLAAIQRKLEQVKANDTEFTEFGSASHQYTMQPPLERAELERWQAMHGITLPEPFACFLLTIGNGGAGPYYGIYTLAQATAYTEPDALSLPAILRPRMPKAEWNELIAPLIADDNISDEQYEQVKSERLGGMLCIGTQGCDYDMYLVLDGQYRGRLVYTNDFYEDTPFFFVYDDHFVDWYERWLDEIILDYDRSWFGSRMPGDEATLLAAYEQTTDTAMQAEVLDALFKFKMISADGLAFLHTLAVRDAAYDAAVRQQRLIAIRLICKSAPPQGKPYVIALLQSDDADELLSGLQIVYHTRERWNTAEFVPIIVQQLHRIDNAEALRYAGYSLDGQAGVMLRDFSTALLSRDEQLQLAAIYATKDCPDKLADIQLVEQLLADASPQIRHQIVLYWGMIADERLLPYYAELWQQYRNQPTVSEKLQHGLQQLGLPADYWERQR
ncbi:SMI1/KNR4 family protein [Paenibacillus campi]|uniref:SMI1/KNR4 family protein n=1 Tax=Paenibacillus campi TaxID=3106031 RepID=UPI002AFDE7DD|nr:SMI1/KNR4 family protein [Paenibacillus sp. SGZ-1009]